MLVPRSFRYSTAATPPMRELDEKDRRRAKRKSASPRPALEASERPASPERAWTEPARAPTPPVDVPSPERVRASEPRPLPTAQRRVKSTGGRRTTPHDPNALPPAVAALLAVTQIPRPKPNQFRRRPATSSRRISIDELVSEWKSEESIKSSFGSSPALNMLLEDHEEEQDQKDVAEEDYLFNRSISMESVPSLEDDTRSIMSNGSLPTPDSLRSRKSATNLRKGKARSLPASVDCATSHPLVPDPDDGQDSDDAITFALGSSSRSTTPRPRTSFKSNLTTSFQALKNAFTSFSLNSVSPAQRSLSPTLSDDMLWSHPFLFPRFSHEIRPDFDGTPTQAQRRYLNPIPLTFEEQETPFQLALHAPFLAEPVAGAATIQMQTYTRGRRRSSSKRGAGGDPQSEAGRAALLATGGVRQREPRENSDFLRVVVLEMNMRREGKLEYGRAKIWLPPRQVSPSPEKREKVPKRWVGESAY